MREIAPDHSGLIFAARTTLPHFSVSSAISLPKSAGRAWERSPAKLRETCLQLRVGKSRIDLQVELVDDLDRRAARGADAVPSAGLVAWHKVTHRREIRQSLRAHAGGHC